jgi:hypothetical protein
MKTFLFVLTITCAIMSCYAASLESAACITSPPTNVTDAIGNICNVNGLGGYVIVFADTFAPVTWAGQLVCNGTAADFYSKYNMLGCCRHTTDLIGCLIWDNTAMDNSCPSGKMCCDNDNNGRFDTCDDFCN